MKSIKAEATASKRGTVRGAIKVSTAKKKAWKEFSLYMRLKSADKKGMCTCYTCGQKLPWKKMQAGHGIGGRNNSVLYMEDVVRTQCIGCNVFGRGQYRIFTRKLIQELGIDRYDDIVKESNKPVKYKAQDHLDIYEKYHALTQEMQSKP